LNDSATRARNAVMPPSSTTTSRRSTSTTRISRKVPDAVSTALRVASSHEVGLVPTSSVIRYTLSFELAAFMSISFWGQTLSNVGRWQLRIQCIDGHGNRQRVIGKRSGC
jgi:hypothetical protein